MRKLHKDLTKVQGSIGYVMMENRDALLSVKSAFEAHELLSKLFLENDIDTPKSRQILFKLQLPMRPDSVVIYMNNIIMKAQNLGC